MNFSHIFHKTLAVVVPTKSIDGHITDDTDLAGPLVFALALGFLLVFSGKLHFGYILGFGIAGCISLYMVLNLMCQRASIDLQRVVSVMGYGLLPIVALAAITVFFDLRGKAGIALGIVCVIWASYSATRFFEAGLQMRDARYLIAYPVLLCYAIFALITIF